MTLLQATEATKEAAHAAANVTAHMNQEGPLYALLWFLVLVAAVIAVIMYAKAEKAITGRQEAVQKAVQDAQAEWARQQAIDNAHADALLKESRDRERDLQNRHDAITRELRQQESKTVEVLAAVRGVLSQLNGGVMTVQQQLQTIETLLSGRPATIRPPILPNDTPL